MKRIKLLFIFLAVIAPIKLSAQDQILAARIIDSDTGSGIGGATISVSARVGTISDTLGYFSIPVNKYPVELTISHLSYGVQTFTINYHPELNLVFKLSLITTRIPEIMVSGKKLQALTKGADYSILAFEFDDTNMWQIGMQYKRPGKTRLYLSNLIGDTLQSLAVDPPVTLRKDVLGNVHLETEDSVFQLFGHRDSIFLLYGEKIEVFNKVMGAYQASLGSGLIYLASDYNLGENYLYYIDSSMSRPIRIHTFEDLPDDLSWLPDGLKQLGRYFGPRTVEQILDQQRSYFRENRPESIFKLKDSLYIVDYNNDKLHAIGPDLKLIRSVPVTFFHRANPTIDNLYINFDYLMTDHINHKVFITYHNNNNWRFVPLDPVTGETGVELPVPQYNAMSNIRFCGGAVYFIYPEKTYPFYYRLFRMVVE